MVRQCWNDDKRKRVCMVTNRILTMYRVSWNSIIQPSDVKQLCRSFLPFRTSTTLVKGMLLLWQVAYRFDIGLMNKWSYQLRGWTESGAASYVWQLLSRTLIETALCGEPSMEAVFVWPSNLGLSVDWRRRGMKKETGDRRRKRNTRNSCIHSKLRSIVKQKGNI